MTSSPTPPPVATSPNISSTFSNAHSLKKRLINEYELEQQRNSPTLVTSGEETSTTNVNVDNAKSENEDEPKSETADEETDSKPTENSV